MLFSTGLLNYVADTGPWADALAGGRLEIYDGTPPLSANSAVTGTLLLTITDLAFPGPAVNGLLTGNPALEWKGAVVASGTARYFRYVVNPGDTGALSTVLRRMQGTVGTSGADMNIPSVQFSAGGEFVIPTDQRSFQV